MYSSKNLTYICTILECIEKISIYTQDYYTADDFAWANDQLNYNATWSLLLVIGEEAKKIDKDLKATYPVIPWRQLAGMRNYLAHDYRGVDAELVFNISKHELQLLKSVLLLMLNDVEYESDALRTALDSPYYSHIQYLRERLNDK
ncbi:DUF86 domain-containing protein [Fibrella sp. HMF5335]|uniref:DUF86 domain-containing protein n=1 Tax=Fibrella rubiginis TaxID=2817060 RepID=A0A939GMA3_9BACT|nr:HepT-like ribonuclease domain-containing protein [Fibrella rubiginis]MBO0939420.1 DUF86 domain-containing protein [Fibrella rubiginis]